jgi:dihydrofolate reductase
LGRLTYEGFAKAWPTMKDTGDFGDMMNGIQKYVVSSTLKSADWKNSKIIKGNIIEEIKGLKDMPGKNILLAGSGKLLQTLMQHDLVDEYRFMVHPVVLGKGQRLFSDMDYKKVLKLADAKRFNSGIVVLTYQPNQR